VIAGQAKGAALAGETLQQVFGDGVAHNTAAVGGDYGNQGSGCPVLGAVGAGQLGQHRAEPVFRGEPGQIATGRRTKQFVGERGANANPASVDRRLHHCPLLTGASFIPEDQFPGAGEDLGEVVVPVG
jgi:hypothetical protein